MKRLALLICLALCPVMSACGKKDESKGGAPSATPSAVASTVASAAPAASASASGAAAGEPATYTGKYTTSAATMHIPEGKDYKGVKQAPDDGSKHVGEGSMTVSVDPSGRVSGEIEEGPASPALIDGVLSEGEIRANVRRKDPKDNGLTGTLQAKLAGANVEGVMKLAESNAAIVREAKVSLTKK